MITLSTSVPIASGHLRQRRICNENFYYYDKVSNLGNDKKAVTGNNDNLKGGHADEIHKIPAGLDGKTTCTRYI
jgi:hypothetical protein